MTAAELGKKGEDCACKYLRKNGYCLIERNYRLRHLEIDLIATKSNQLYLFEIKTRCSDAVARLDNALSNKQIVNLKKAARQCAAVFNYDMEKTNFDLIIVSVDQKNSLAELTHYKNIF